MIRLISGTVAYVGAQSLIVETAGGVGYLVAVTNKVTALPNDTITLFTHLAVRDTALDLYGFTAESDLLMFERLLTIPKVGPKSALQIMDHADTTLLISSIQNQDEDQLTKLSGLTKKTAEKIIQSLKNKIDDLAPLVETKEVVNDAYKDAFDTLITLGYNPVAIRGVLDSLPKDSTTSTFVKDALRQLS